MGTIHQRPSGHPGGSIRTGQEELFVLSMCHTGGGKAIRIIPRRKWSFRAAETIAQWRFLLGNSSRNEIYSWENDLQMEVFDAGTIISVYG